MMFSKLSKSFIFTGLLSILFVSCVGTVEDTEEIVNSKEAKDVRISFDGIFDCYAISQDKVEVRFSKARITKGAVSSEDLVYQAFLNGNFNIPVNSNKIENLRIDDEDLYHLTIGNLVRNTSYSISVKALDPSTNTIDTNIETCTVRTLDEEYPLFDGLEVVEPTPGILGQNELVLRWNTATPAKFILGSIAADGYKIKKYNIYWSDSSGSLENLTLLTEITEDNFNPITSYKVTGLLPGSNYYFLARAEDESNREERNIKVLSARTNLPAVTSFVGIQSLTVPKTKSGYTSLVASWPKASGDFDRYRIFAIPKSSPAFSSNTVNPNNGLYLKSEVTNVDATSAIIPGLTQNEEYAVFVVACMYDSGTDSCVTYDGEDVKLSAITTPPLAPYAGVGSVQKLEGTAGLSTARLLWNPPAISQGVCDNINLYFVDSANNEEPIYSCNDELADPTKPCFSEGAVCDDTQIILSGISLDTEYCFRSKVFENGREQETENKKCFTNRITKPVFPDSPTCTALDGGTELQIDWPTPSDGDYANYILFVEQVEDGDTSALNANNWMNDAVEAYEAGATTTYTTDVLDKTINTKKLRYKVPDTKYRIGIKTLISANGTNYFDDNANVVECKTKSMSLNFQGWRHALSVGPRINGVGDHKLTQTTIELPRAGYTGDEITLEKAGVVREYYKYADGRIIPTPKVDSVQKYIYSNRWYLTLLDNSKRLNFTYEADNSLPSPYFKVEYDGDSNVKITARTGSYSSNECRDVSAYIANDTSMQNLFSLTCASYDYRTMNYAAGGFPVTLDGLITTDSGNSGLVAINWEPVRTSTGELIEDFLFNNQIASDELDGYYIYRKEVPIANTKQDLTNLLNNVNGSGSGWVELNTGKPVKSIDELTYIDVLPDGFHPIHGSNISRSQREKANTGKVVWYTVRYRMAGKIMNYNQDGESTDAILQVLIPPANMASIHPWIANLQMCKQMGKEVDRQNDYRCEFGGLGSTKIDNQYYYDLGGYVLVDRWQLGCNVTFDGDIDKTNGTSKFCDMNPSASPYYMTEAPDRSCYMRGSSDRPSATPNSVGYEVGGGFCILNEDNGSSDPTYSNWKKISEITGDTPATTTLPTYETSEALGRSYAGSAGYGEIISTNDSSMPPILNVNFKEAHLLCQSHTVQVQTSSLISAKIRKRQLSSREYQHVTMPSLIEGDKPYAYELETSFHGNDNPDRGHSFYSYNNGSGHCNKESRYWDYITDYSDNARVISGKLNYMWGSSWRKANFVTGSYNMSGRGIRTGGTDHCVSGFGIQDYLGVNHFLNDHALCKKYSDDSNATCEIYPEQSWIDAYSGIFPLTKFIEDDYADREIYKNAFEQKFFWKYFDDGSLIQYGKPRATATTRTYGSYAYPISGYEKATHLMEQMSNLSSFSFALGMPLNCLSGESYCHPDDKGAFPARSSASDYGTYILDQLASDFDLFYPIEYNPNLATQDEYFAKVLTVESYDNLADYYGDDTNKNLYYDDGSGSLIQVQGVGYRSHNRYMTNWDYSPDYRGRNVGVRCGVKVELDLAGSLRQVDDKDLN
ncbi:hypothetical protein [Halobacteriovorax sp. ZH4_bin.1]|uniref:hypothetical protein n=1 Tax=unclassified Halobacteriovorax TaxID=2639665 RepID=UPI003718F3E5